MKILLFSILCSMTLFSFGQKTQITGQIAKSQKEVDYKYLTIFLKQNDSTISGAIPDTTGYFKIKNIPDGCYNLVVQEIGSRDFVIENIKIDKDTTINFIYPPPCLFIHHKGERIACIGGHTDHIIPIVYGYPTQKTLKKAKKGIVHLGGCVVTDCDPHYYCTIHKKDL
jgi:hypothetical protein